MEPPSQAPVRQHLGLWDAVSIIVGIVVGAGIYETSPLIFNFVSGPWAGLGVWALGGALAFVGALCYAELATTYPRSGGEYVYLTRAFGPWLGLLFGWAQLTIIRTGNIGMMAYVFADYMTNGFPDLAHRLGGLGLNPSFSFAALAVVVLTVLNMLGIVFGKMTQNILTAAKVLGLGSIVAAGLFAMQSSAQVAAPVDLKPPAVNFGLAMVFVLYTYGGWNDAAMVAAEQRNPRRNIPLALLLGTVLITAIYLLVNGAYLLSLGFDGARSSRAIAADALYVLLRENGSRAVSVFVMVSALGAMNGMIMTGSRIYSSLGADQSLFAWLGRWDTERGSPLWSLATQMALILGMIAAVGTEPGRNAINSLLERVGLGTVKWEGHGGFDTLLKCTAPSFWLFFLLVGVSLFVLRQKDPDIERPFTVPFYPLLPLIFCDTCAYMLYAATDYAGKLALLAFAIVHVGLVFYWFSKKRSTSVKEEQP